MIALCMLTRFVFPEVEKNTRNYTEKISVARRLVAPTRALPDNRAACRTKLSAQAAKSKTG